MARFNVQTADYEPNSLLRPPHESMTLSEAAYLRLTTHRGSYWPDATFGSRLHELTRSKDVPRLLQTAKHYTEEALAPLKTLWKVSSLTVNVSHQSPGRILIKVAMTTIAGIVSTLTYWVKVAG